MSDEKQKHSISRKILIWFASTALVASMFPVSAIATAANSDDSQKSESPAQTEQNAVSEDVGMDVSKNPDSNNDADNNKLESGTQDTGDDSEAESTEDSDEKQKDSGETNNESESAISVNSIEADEGAEGAENEESEKASIASQEELVAAIAAANANDVLKVTDDFTVNNKIALNKRVVIDLDSHTITVDAASGYFASTKNGTTVRNGSIVETGNSAPTALFLCYQNGFTLNLENITFSGNRFALAYNGGKFKIVNCNITSYLKSGGSALTAGNSKYAAGSFELINTNIVTVQAGEDGQLGCGVYLSYGANLIMDATSSIYAHAGSGISIWDNSKASIAGTVVADQNFAVVNNGKDASQKPQIDIQDGAWIECAGIYHAMYLPAQYGVTTIGKATVKGAEGIQLRGGKLAIDGANVIATREDSVEPGFSDKGAAPSNAALSVLYHTHKVNPELIINSGTFSGPRAFVEYDNPLSDEKHVSDGEVKITINGGTFTSSFDLNPVDVTYAEKFIFGGTYSAPLDEAAIADGCKSITFDEATYEVVSNEEASEDMPQNGLVVAEMNGIYYGSLQDAVNKAEYNGKITLLKSVDEPVIIDKRVRIALENNTINEVTIKGDGNQVSDQVRLYGGTVNKVTITNNGKLESWKMNIDEIQAPDGRVYIHAGGKYGIINMSGSNGSLYIEKDAGVFEGKNAISGDENCKIQILGGTYDYKVPQNYCADGYTCVSNGKGKYVIKTVKEAAVAAITTNGNTVYYLTVNDAIKAANDGDTITLLKNTKETVVVRSENPVVLDLNGKTIENGNYKDTAFDFTIQNSGTLTIKDSSSEQTGKVMSRLDDAINNFGTLNVESGTIQGGTDYYGIFAGKNSVTNVYGIAKVNGEWWGICASDSADAATQINVYGDADVSSRNPAGTNGGITTYGATTNIYGNATVHGACGINTKGPLTVSENAKITAEHSGAGTAIGVYTGADVTIEGGVIQGGAYGISGNGNGDSAGAKVVINNGDISAEGAGIYQPHEGTLTINGGKISGGVGVQACRGTVTISDPAEIIGTESDDRDSKNGDGVIIDGAAVSLVKRGGGYGESGPIAKISGGIYRSTKSDAVLVYDFTSGKTAEWTDLSGFISGGKFSSDVADYCVDGCTTGLDDSNMYVVHEHNVVIDKAVAATCTEDGLTEGAHCDLCTKDYVKQEVVPALEHDWGEWVVTTPAAPGVAGEQQRVCNHDATHVQTETIAALPVVEPQPNPDNNGGNENADRPNNRPNNNANQGNNNQNNNAANNNRPNNNQNNVITPAPALAPNNASVAANDNADDNEEAIADNENPLAGQDEQTINDEENPLAGNAKLVDQGEVQGAPFDWTLWALMIAGAAVLGFFIIILVRRKKDDEEEQQA